MPLFVASCAAGLTPAQRQDCHARARAEARNQSSEKCPLDQPYESCKAAPIIEARYLQDLRRCDK